MKGLEAKVKTPGAVEKMNGAYRLKPDATSTRARSAEDMALLAKSSLKVDELAAIVGRLMERVKELEEG
jgi:hypothetical protein